MPYIKQEDRERLRVYLMGLPGEIRTAGELNYVVTHLALEFVHRHGVSYATLNEAMGVLGAAQAEFYRRAVAPYEDKKIQENGDVF